MHTPRRLATTQVGGGGQSYPEAGADCTGALDNCYIALANGKIPEEDWDKNTWGFNEPLRGDGGIHDCFTQSGACSRFMDQGPGMQAISQLHDTWMNQGGALPSWMNFPSMPFAAAITYGALAGSSAFNFIPWMRINTPSWARSPSAFSVAPATSWNGQ
jgi:hypothetical protein